MSDVNSGQDSDTLNTAIQAPVEPQQSMDDVMAQTDTRSVDEMVFGDLGDDVQATPDATPEVVPEEENPGSRAQQRIRQLANQKKAAEQQLAQIQQQQQQYQMQLAQTEAKWQEWARQAQWQNQQLQQQLAQQQQQREEANLRPEERWERDLQKRLMQQAEERIVKQYVTPLQQELEARRAAEAQRAQQEEQRARYQRLDSVTKEASSQVVLKDLLPEDQQKLNQFAYDLTLTSAAAYGEDPRKVAHMVKQQFEQYHMARLRAEQLKARERIQKNADAPKVAQGLNRAGASVTPNYSREQILKAGYESRLEAAADGYRKLR